MKQQKQNLLTRKKLNLLQAGSLIAIVIFIAPFLFYSYRYGGFPEGNTWETSMFTFKSVYYESVSTFVWVFYGKLIPFYLLTIWFFTCRYWWRYAILAPIGMYAFQMVSLFNDELKFKDEPLELIYILPTTICVAIILTLIRNKLKNYIHLLSLNESVNAEIEKLKTN